MKNRIKIIIVATAITLGLVSNLQFAFFNYGMGEFNLSLPVIAQNGDTSGGSTSHPESDPVPTACPTATVIRVYQQTNNVRSCRCTASYRVVVSTNPTTFEYRSVFFAGIENPCNSGSANQYCDAFACSTQTSGGST